MEDGGGLPPTLGAGTGKVLPPWGRGRRQEANEASWKPQGAVGETSSGTRQT